MFKFLDGYKTIIVGILTIIVALADVLVIAVPEPIYLVLVGLGLIAGRSVVTKIIKLIKELKDAFESILVNMPKAPKK